MRLAKILLCFLIVIVLSSKATWAGGTNRSSIFGARASALNGLYFAGVDGISNIYLNPAGLAYKQGKSIQATLFFKSEQNSFNGQVRGIYNSIREEDANFGLGYYWSIMENMTIGLAYEDVLNYRVDWPYVLIVKSGQTSNVTTTDLFYQEKFKTISPVISYKLGDFSVGLSANITNVNIETAFAQKNYNWIDTVSQPIYQVDLKKDGWLWNLNLGVMYEFNESLRAGVSVSNGIDNKLDGTAKSQLYAIVDSAGSKVNYTSKFQSPMKLGFGLFYKLTDKININLDVKYSLYDKLDDKIEREFDDNIWQEKSAITDTLTGFSVSSLPQYYRNSADMGIGAEYLAMDNLDILWGYRFSQTPNTGKTYSLLNPTVDQHMLSAGFVYRDNNIVLEGSLVYFIGVKEKANDTLFKVHNGSYNTSGFISTLTLKYEL